MKLFEELRRRNVFRVAIGYVIASWLILQVTDVVMGLLELPSWIGRLVFYALLLGFPLALASSWLFQLTPEGLKRDSELTPAEAAAPAGGRKLDLAIIALLVISLGYFVLDKFVFTQPRPEGTSVMRYDKSIAVLPFDTRGEEGEGGLFAEGIHDDLLTQLAKIADLHVISRTSVMGYAGTTKNMPQIGRELGVRHILEGGVQKIGDQVRINAQLIDAHDDRHLWAETFDRRLTVDNIFMVQSEIVGRISDSLHATLLPEVAASIEKAPTGNMEAYRDYMAAMHGNFRADVRRDLLQSAVEKDPEFALAWAWLAYFWQQDYWFDPEQPEALDRALEAFGRAATIDPDLPQLHLIQAHIRYHGYLDYEGALSELQLAEVAMPGDSLIYELRATIYRHMQRLPEAVAEYRRALELDPFNDAAYWELGITLSNGRYYDEAREVWSQAMGKFPAFLPQLGWMRASEDWAQFGDSSAQLEWMDRPDWPKYERHNALVALKTWQAGDLASALSRARLIDPNDPLEINLPNPTPVSREEAELIQAGILMESGEVTQARQILEAARQRLEGEISNRPSLHWSDLPYLANVLGMLGERAQAIELADRMIDLFDEPKRIFILQGVHLFYARLMCQLGELDVAEEEIRWLLPQHNGFTLASIVNEWPPCRQMLEGSENLRRLEDEFADLSRGRTLE